MSDQLPVVAIVGRPNVGKSTLFNRIYGKPEAIVHDLPGVTRDRHYAVADWAGKSFTIMDTGGFVPDTKDEMEIAIREQSQMAIQQADVIVFMTDVTTGVTDYDLAVAAELKRTDKPVFLIVNKVDNDQREAEVFDFMKLGLGVPYGLAASLGRKTGDFLDMITEHFNLKDTPEDGRLKLAIVGRPNVGKSSLVNAFLGENRLIVSPIAGTTRDSIDTVIKFHGEDIVLIDTAGLRRRTKVKESIEFYSTVRTQRAIERSDIVVLLIDAVEGYTDQDSKIIEEAVRLGRGIIICVNKWDLVEKNDETYKQFENFIKFKLGMYQYIPLIFTSTITRQRMLKILEKSLEIKKQKYQKISTSELNSFFQPIFQTQPPPATLGKHIKIKYVTQMGNKTPTFALFTNFPKLVADHYKRFLENKFRDKYGYEGIPIRFLFKEKN